MNEENERAPRSGWLMPLLVIGGMVGGWFLWRSGPVAEPREKVREAKMVRTVTPKPQSPRVSLTAHGELIPARRLVVEPEVSGRIIRQHAALMPGGRIEAGAELFVVDDALSRLELRGAEAAIKRAEADLLEARRRQAEAKRLADEDITSKTELAARDAEVAVEQAELEQFQAAHARAEEVLRRHVVKAPFNSLVIEEAVEVGQRVDSGFSAATLVGTDEFWVRAAVPIDQLRWIQLPAGDQPGAVVRVYLESGDGKPAELPGRVVRLLGDIERTGRMARVLVSVADPLGLKAKAGSRSFPFLLGSYVRVEIDAGKLDDALVLERAALREGDRLWVAEANGELQIRDTEVLWRQGETVFVRNALRPGDALIVSPLRVALPGMKVQARPVEDAP